MNYYNLNDLKKLNEYLKGLNDWLTKIQEYDEASRNEVIELFKNNAEYRKFIIGYADLK